MAIIEIITGKDTERELTFEEYQKEAEARVDKLKEQFDKPASWEIEEYNKLFPIEQKGILWDFVPTSVIMGGMLPNGELSEEAIQHLKKYHKIDVQTRHDLKPHLGRKVQTVFNERKNLIGIVGEKDTDKMLKKLLSDESVEGALSRKLKAAKAYEDLHSLGE